MRNFRQLLLGFVTAFACATSMAAGPNVLVVGADSDSTITAGLIATGQLGSVTYYDATGGTPGLMDLQSYNAVLAFTNFPPADATGLGNILQQYVDGGGRLVMNTYAFSNPWAISGGIMGAGYSPLVNTGVNGGVSGSLVQVAPSAIFNGVDLSMLTYFNNGNYAQPGLDMGATLLATDGMGVNMIAINSNGRIISNNLFPNTFGNNEEFYQLTANELVVVAGAVPEPETYAMLMLGLAAVGYAAKRRKA